MAGPRSTPPELPGFTFTEGIGGGGFADVFLYTRHRPARKVAVKVLRKEHLSADMLRQFESEADVMAEVSAHPYIVTIFGMGVAADGRPFIEMEYYPNPHFGARAQGGTLAVEEVLRVGVQVASAVETAHRAGILHRDVKPANILTSAYGKPGLTDFGIASVVREGVASAAAGLSVAFAPPEVVRDESVGSVAGDVYGLSVTLHTMLTGHSPFLLPTGDNNLPRIIDRVLRSEIPPIARSDVPPSLQHLLRQGMAADPAQRPPSALTLARALNDIERELHLAATAIDVGEVALPAGRSAPGSGLVPGQGRGQYLDDDDDGTRAAAIQVVSPDGTLRGSGGVRAGLASPAPLTGGVGAIDESTVARPGFDVVSPSLKVPREVALPATTAPSRRRSPVVVAVLVACAVFVAIVLALRLGTKGSGSSSLTPNDPGVSSISDDGGFTVPDPPTGVTVADDSGVGSGRTFSVTWTPGHGAQATDTYKVVRDDAGHDTDRPIENGTSTRVTGLSYTAGTEPCVRVIAVRGGHPSASSEPACLRASATGTTPG